MKHFTYNNIDIYLGESAIENWDMLNDIDPSNYFFHLSSFPSGYCSVLTDELTPDIIEYAAMLCKRGTKYRNLSNVYVDYCPYSNLRKGSKPGEAVFKSKRKVQRIKV